MQHMYEGMYLWMRGEERVGPILGNTNYHEKWFSCYHDMGHADRGGVNMCFVSANILKEHT
jgi:hypothetical protein